ncbi:UDP-glucose 4-epimerase [Chlorella vulgaris]
MELRTQSFGDRRLLLLIAAPVCAVLLYHLLSSTLVTPQHHILVTGGLGYIGSHTALSLVEAGYVVTLLDDLSNAHEEVFVRLQELAGGRSGALSFIKGDVRDLDLLRPLLDAGAFDAVIHFAAKKSVAESTVDPLGYYNTNVVGTVRLLEAMQGAGVRNAISSHDLAVVSATFARTVCCDANTSSNASTCAPSPYACCRSSSACVYGAVQAPINESAPLQPLNPYGHSKAMAEQVMADVAAADPSFRCLQLRYFNPVGAHPSGRLGEQPQQPTNLMPCITEVVHGTDYPTHDGTAQRDYLHVLDLAEAHAAALRKLLNSPGLGCKAYNLGTGTGQTVLEVIKAFEKASGRSVPYVLAGRRAGDAAAAYASPQLAEEELGWRVTRSLHQMCADHWRWTEGNPSGYLTDSGGVPA